MLERIEGWGEKRPYFYLLPAARAAGSCSVLYLKLKYSGWLMLTIAGLLVGIGTHYTQAVPAAMASVGYHGCRRVHWRPARLAIAAGFATVFVLRRLLGA
jgi:uncharacterized membrane protein YedE/YeeE